jgi:hypothetical protein
MSEKKTGSECPHNTITIGDEVKCADCGMPFEHKSRPDHLGHEVTLTPEPASSECGTCGGKQKVKHWTGTVVILVPCPACCKSAVTKIEDLNRICDQCGERMVSSINFDRYKEECTCKCGNKMEIAMVDATDSEPDKGDHKKAMMQRHKMVDMANIEVVRGWLHELMDRADETRQEADRLQKELEEAHDKCNEWAERAGRVEATVAGIDDAIGSGADQELWPPGKTRGEAIKALIEELDEERKEKAYMAKKLNEASEVIVERDKAHRESRESTMATASKEIGLLIDQRKEIQAAMNEVAMQELTSVVKYLPLVKIAESCDTSMHSYRSWKRDRPVHREGYRQER